MCNTIIYLLIILLLLNYFNKIEGLTSRPNNYEINYYTSQILKNKHLFRVGKYSDAKNKLSWLDPVVYENIRMLGNINETTIKNILS